MAVERFNPNSDVKITITPRAAKHFLTQMAAHPEQKLIRLSTKKTGCSGLSYVTALVAQQQTDDIKASTEHRDLFVVIEAKSVPYLNGLTIDFVDAQLGQSKLVYINPNETGKCGCGESFAVEDKKL